MSLFAGAAGMGVLTFFSLNLLGTVGRLYLNRVFGDTFSEPIDIFRDFVGQYQTWFLLGSIALVLFSIRNKFRGDGDIDDLRHLGETLIADPMPGTVAGDGVEAYE